MKYQYDFLPPKLCLSVFSFHCRYGSAAVMVITSVLPTPRPKISV